MSILWKILSRAAEARYSFPFTNHTPINSLPKHSIAGQDYLLGTIGIVPLVYDENVVYKSRPK